MREQTVTQTQVHPAFRIFVLGPLRLERRISPPGEPACFTAIKGKALGDRPGVMLALLKLLLSSEQRYATKALLAETLWLEVQEESALRSLRTAKLALSKLLRTPEGRSLLYETPDGLGLYLVSQAELEVDADVFEATVQAAVRAEHTSPPEQALLLWQHAYDVWTGTYLPGDVGVDWTEPRRLVLETHYALCVQRLALSYRGKGHLSEAEYLLHTYWATHLTDEEVLLQLMDLVVAQGRPLTALHFYQASVQALRQELDVAPCEQLTLLAGQLRKQRIAASFALAGTQQNLDASYQLSSDGLRWPANTFMLSEMALEGAESAAVLGEQTMRLVQATTRWYGQAVFCHHLQSLLHQELERWTTMTQSNDELLISRRMALATLVAMPLGLVPVILAGQRSPLVLEEFLPACTASLTACWQLFREVMLEEDFTTIATQLLKYLPALELLAQQPSRYRKTAAKLATQGCILMGLLAMHHLVDLHLREAYCRRAARYGRESGDQALYVTALMYLACTLHLEQKPSEALRVHEQAVMLISAAEEQISPLLKNQVFVQIAAIYARNGQVQQALRYVSKAREFLPGHAPHEPLDCLADRGLFSAFLGEGITYGYLGQLAVQQGLSKRPRVLYTAAHTTLAQFEQLDATILVPERWRVEVINHQAKTAIDLGDMERFQTYFQAGAQRAKALGSQKRKQEAIDNWRLARLRWPDETVIKDLADLLL
jgi:DNA-binding SARP family transcriptional activator